MILLVGGTGHLGSRIARKLAQRGVGFRALVRPATDAGSLEALGAEVVRGDLREPETLPPALAGIETVISTANAMARALAGTGDTIADVDGRGNQSLIAAAEAAGAGRFVFLSAGGIDGFADCPFGRAKLAAERRLQESPLHEVVLRPDMFCEVWLSAPTGFDWQGGKVTVYGRGEAPAAYVSSEDVAELAVRLALADDPPRLLEFGGPEALTRLEAVELFERLTVRPIRVRTVPRAALRAGSALLRRPKPHLASVMAMTLSADLETAPRSDRALREAGIEPLPVSLYAERIASERIPKAATTAPPHSAAEA